MPTKPVMAVFDSAVGAFMSPFVVPAVGAAMRGFADEVNKSGPDAGPVSQHPEDFELHELALFDEENGRFLQAENHPRLVSRGKDAVRRSE